MSVAAAERLYTAEEYLALEREAETKSEYFEGRIFAMSGASREHNLIAGNLFRNISNQLDERPCEVYVSDMRVKVSADGLYTYPDVAAVCEPPQIEDAHGDTLLNPSLIIEVLSLSTEAYDRSEKFAHYRKLESLTDYVLVSQDRVQVEHFVRSGEKWLHTRINSREDTLEIRSIGCSVPLRDIYKRVRLAP
ncbi:MAG TPA: Uma2 family endonuclease [Armatimonadota bacterium]|nr:Uma2 family endonuclease [Armatimonadota bacterium]